MAVLIDSGFLYALVDDSDRNHAKVREAVVESISSDETLILPTVSITEIAYLIGRNLGHRKIVSFINTLEIGPINLICLEKSDFPRVQELMGQYDTLELDFVDASITTLAERLDIRRIMTVDRRDFSVIRPKHCDYFELIP